MRSLVQQGIKRIPHGVQLVAPYLVLPGLVLTGLLVIVGLDLWSTLYTWGKGVCQMYLADLSLARVALDLGKLLAAAAVGAGVVAMLREGRQLRLLRRSLENARCTIVSKEPYIYPVVVVDDAVPFAFCGGIIRPNIYFSTGLARLLTTEELKAVLAHEEAPSVVTL
jgi:Zn-dependent protease with chaperone function